MKPAVVAKTVDRSVLGVLVDSARLAPSYVGPVRMDETALRLIESRLEQVPWFAGKRMDDIVFAADKTRELLRERWGSG